MDLEKKLIKLNNIIEDSELVTMVRKHFDEDTSEEMVLELKIKLIKLIEEK